MEGDFDPMSIRSIDRFSRIKRSVYYTAAGRPPICRKTCLLFAGLIAAMVYVFAITGGSFQKLVITQGLFVLCVVFFIIFSQRRLAFTARGIFILLILALVLSGNLLVNFGNYVAADRSLAFAILHVGGILVFAFFAQWVVSNLQPEYVLKSTAWMLAPLVILALAIGQINVEIGRAAPFGVHPNWWGEVAFGFILCSLALSRVMAKMIFVVVGLGLMFTVQSRGALLGAIVSLLAYLAMQYRPLGQPIVRKLAISGVVMLGGLLFVMMTGSWLAILDFVESKILLIDDPYRGLDSALTGRLAGWREAVTIFNENPIFGQGFDTLLKVHNGFLRWAGEGGILLLGVMLMLMISAMVRSWRRRNDWAFAALLGIAAYMMTYPRALNLNLVGMVFLLALFPWKGVRTQGGNSNLTGLPRLQHSSPY